MSYLGKIELNLCEIRMNRIPDQKSINYSDHAGIYAEFSISERHDEVPVYFYISDDLYLMTN